MQTSQGQKGEDETLLAILDKVRTLSRQKLHETDRDGCRTSHVLKSSCDKVEVILRLWEKDLADNLVGSNVAKNWRPARRGGDEGAWEGVKCHNCLGN